MTDPKHTEPVVTQADRNAAADATRANHTRYPWSFADRMKAGELDSHPLVQAFARHRTAAEAASRAMIQQLGENAAKAAKEYADNMGASRAEVERLREALARTVDALVKHHQWHAAQTEPDPDHGFVPADEYADSSLYGVTVDALAAASKATGPHDFCARAALSPAAKGGDHG